jgi:hypothetical protein
VFACATDGVKTALATTAPRAAHARRPGFSVAKVCFIKKSPLKITFLQHRERGGVSMRQKGIFCAALRALLISHEIHVTGRHAF